jgi:hypothetical protein
MNLTHEDCLEHNPDEPTCKGEVEYHSTDPGRAAAFPRCEHHWTQRLDRRENSMEMYADSDVPPSWFDPSIAGERWDEDY